MTDKPWQDWVILAASGWLFFSPFILDYATLTHPAAWVAFVCSIGLFVSASEALVVPDAIEEWVDGGVALAMIASPWLLGFSRELVPTINTSLVGMLVMVFAALALARDLQGSVAGHHFTVRT